MLLMIRSYIHMCIKYGDLHLSDFSLFNLKVDSVISSYYITFLAGEYSAVQQLLIMQC